MMIEANDIFVGCIDLVIGFAVALLVFLVTRLMIAKTKPGIFQAVITALGLPATLYVLVATVYITISGHFFELIPFEAMYFAAICILIGTWAAHRLATRLVNVVMCSANENMKKFCPLVLFIAKILIWMIGLFMILGALAIDITPLLAGAGVAGIAVALAAQDIIGNIFSGFMLNADMPFNEGDWVSISGNYGQVVHVGIRSTRIMTADNQLMTIPNSSVSADIIINYSKPTEYMVVHETIGVAYGSDLELVRESLFEAMRSAMKDTTLFSNEVAPNVFFMEFADSSLNFEITFCAASPSVKKGAINAVNCEVDRIFRERNIDIPFPQRVVTIVKE